MTVKFAGLIRCPGPHGDGCESLVESARGLCNDCRSRSDNKPATGPYRGAAPVARMRRGGGGFPRKDDE